MITRLTILLLLLITGFSSKAAPNPVSKELINRITESQKSLQALESKINEETLKYQVQLDKELAAVKALREQATTIQRTADEQLMSIEQLSDRINKWREQDNYQKLLLQTYLEQENITFEHTGTGDIAIKPEIFQQLRNELIDDLAPSWQQTDVISTNGEVKSFNVLNVGPIQLAYNSQLQSGGLLENPVNQTLPNLVKGISQNAQAAQLQQLNQTGIGSVTFDPTLGNATKLQNNQQGIVSHIKKGGVWALPILFFGLLALIAALLKSIQLMRLPRISKDFIEQLNAKKTLLEVQIPFDGAEKKLVQIALDTPVSEQRDDQIVSYLMQHQHKVENYLGVVTTTAAIAPLLGLLGTVSGMINTFMMMNTFGTGDAATVSGGISEALVTTELGLIVAIPSLIISALLNRKAKSYNAKLEANAIQLSKFAMH
tara:strand:+ start:217 stop:1506 length:1290 start_codon:yes stop_codon:yes gene_type:complete